MFSGKAFADGYEEALDQHCARLGQVEVVSHEMAFMQWPKVHVHVHRGSPGRPWVTLRTEGMAQERLATPRGSDLDRVELLLYYPGRDEQDVPDWPVEVVRDAAHLVHDAESCYDLYDTVQFDADLEPIDGTDFVGVLVRPPAAEPADWATMPHRRDSVHFLEVVMLTRDELALKLEQGSAALADRLGALGVPGVNDPARTSRPVG